MNSHLWNGASTPSPTHVRNQNFYAILEQSTALSLTKQMLLDVVLLVAGVCTVCYWRGVWYLWDVYLWPEDPVKSAWFTHVLGKYKY